MNCCSTYVCVNNEVSVYSSGQSDVFACEKPDLQIQSHDERQTGHVISKIFLKYTLCALCMGAHASGLRLGNENKEHRLFLSPAC